MKKVGSRDFKNRNARYLRQARKGETIIVTARGKPIAQLGPVQGGGDGNLGLEARLRELAGQGHIRLAQRPLAPFRPLPQTGKLASRMVVEDRD